MTESAFEDILDALASSVVRVEETIRGLPPEALDEVIHTGDGAWTRRQLIAHMAANDLRQLVRIRIGAGIPAPGDDLAHARELAVHDWNRARVDEREGFDVPELLAEMRANRESLLALLRSLTPEQRSRPMPFRGTPTPLEDMIPVLIGHLDGHAAELVAPS